MSTTTQEGVFILLKVIKRHEEKRPEGRTELAKLKATKMSPAKHLFKDFMQCGGQYLSKKRCTIASLWCLTAKCFNKGYFKEAVISIKITILIWIIL